MASENEKAELHKAIWGIADSVRGAVDGWDFKAYILCFLFYRFISEDLCEFIDEGEHEAGDPDFSYAAMSDGDAEAARAGITEDKGYFILPSQLFCNVAKDPARDPELNVRVAGIFKAIEASSVGQPSEKDFKGLFDDVDVTSNKLGGNLEERCERLAKIIIGIRDLDFGKVDESHIDLFGDAYEYLMNMYASSAGKSGGEFFTPQEVSELLARLTTQEQRNVNKIYDPACGSGSLLLKAYRAARATSDADVEVYGQEINLTTYNMCRINMILHGVSYAKCDIALGDTLVSPKHWDYEPFDVIVSNPPYSIKWEGDKNPTLINDPRFAPAGVLAPKGNADLAFVMHALAWLSNKGAAAIVCFPGVFYRGGAEQKIRRHLVEQNNVDAVIALPDNLFFGTSIATNVLVLKKNKKDNRVLFVDATREFVKVTKNNKLTEENIAKIADVVKNRRDIEYFSRVVPFDEIEKNKFNLTPSTYVEKPDTREKIDIVALNAEIKRIVAREEELRRQIDLIVADLEGV